MRNSNPSSIFNFNFKNSTIFFLFHFFFFLFPFSLVFSVVCLSVFLFELKFNLAELDNSKFELFRNGICRFLNNWVFQKVYRITDLRFRFVQQSVEIGDVFQLFFGQIEFANWCSGTGNSKVRPTFFRQTLAFNNKFKWNSITCNTRIPIHRST